jgi:hypothetical protein
MRERREKCIYVYIMLPGKPEGKTSLGRLGRSWGDEVIF